jgi:hypothetical protein
MAIEVSPGRIAMQQHHRLPVPYVHIVHLTVTAMQMVRGERKSVVKGVVLEIKHTPRTFSQEDFLTSSGLYLLTGTTATP